ncbi:MAG: DUF3772 domain-containing protein, partial [Pseudolabrys sp.]|nr:DUF3772 domain-containing protein [Pseudolabrys sp.]
MRLLRGLLIIVTAAIASAGGASRVMAQTSAAQAELVALEPVRQDINQVEAALRRGGLSVNALGEFSRRLIPVRDDLRNRIAELEPRLAQIDERLKQLGPAPARDTAPEASQIADERARLNAAHSDLDAALKQARLLASRAEQASADLLDRRRSAYAQEMLEQSSSALSPFFWIDAAGALSDEVSALGLVLRTWWSLVAAGGLLKLASAAFLGLLLA